MSNTIRFLESMGNNPVLGRLPPDDYAALVASLDVEPAQLHALLQKDHTALSGLLGGRNRMICAIYAPEDQPLKEDQPVEEGEEHEGDQEELKMSQKKLPPIN